jgi:hypothetical protein
MKLQIMCRRCKKTIEIEIDRIKYEVWKRGNGPYIQELFPELTPDERELMVSNTCGPCFDELYKEPEKKSFLSEALDREARMYEADRTETPL